MEQGTGHDFFRDRVTKMMVSAVLDSDAEHEEAYDRQSSVARLAQALDEVQAKGWAVVDRKKKWNRVFSFEKP